MWINDQVQGMFTADYVFEEKRIEAGNELKTVKEKSFVIKGEGKLFKYADIKEAVEHGWKKGEAPKPKLKTPVPTAVLDAGEAESPAPLTSMDEDEGGVVDADFGEGAQTVAVGPRMEADLTDEPMPAPEGA